MDPSTGTMIMKKLEPDLNTISPVLTYLVRGNTDITNLRSGTALKGVVLYMLDYITKVSVKTHIIFDIIRSVFCDNVQILGSSDSSCEKTRRLMTKVVNSLTTKMELGAPMIAMYLLGNLDHYTSHQFAPFFWSSFANTVEKEWSLDLSTDLIDEAQKVMVFRQGNRIVGLPNTFDYIIEA